LRFFFQTHGITHLTTPPYTLEHNGLSKRKHYHLVKIARCLLYHASLSISFWSYALETATHLINRMPTPGLNMKSPLESLFHSSPNYFKLRTFRCLCFPSLVSYLNNKLLPKSQPCFFLRYNSSQRAYLYYNFKTKKVYTLRHVHFVEYVFPYSSTLTTTSSLSPTSIPTCMQTFGASHPQTTYKSFQHSCLRIQIPPSLPPLYLPHLKNYLKCPCQHHRIPNPLLMYYQIPLDPLLHPIMISCTLCLYLLPRT